MIEKNTSAPSLGQFDNPITALMLLLVLGLIGVGLWFAWQGTLISTIKGLALGGIGTIIWYFGETEHKASNPREAGVLTLWDTPISIPPWLAFGTDRWEHYIVVGGTVILADYRPFLLGSIKVDIENKDFSFKVNVLTQDRVEITLEVFTTMRPDVNDLPDFIQAGNDMKRVFEQFASIASKSLQKLATTKSLEDIYFNRGQYSEELEANVAHFFETKTFGVVVIKVNFEPRLPDEVAKKLREIKYEDWERTAELAEFATITMAAISKQREFAKEHLAPEFSVKDPAPSDYDWSVAIRTLVEDQKIPSLEECEEIVKTQRLVKDKRIVRIESNSGGNIHVANVQLPQI